MEYLWKVENQMAHHAPPDNAGCAGCRSASFPYDSGDKRQNSGNET
eukprot:CAMPEP_0169150316 /NCGR_PEP_ID=MMETSP1015-20121227/50103_1 /TAXON_ID=342587 /ORGANISM="Karlodinium micrum, Strain CCMP2283" /LENGTH=45 /DNA_ID= /DNA_START= /DNA_END= /DNA_ORIENTATION=